MRGGQAPQEAGVSVNVFFYLKKAGSAKKKQPRVSQKMESKMRLGPICRFRVCKSTVSQQGPWLQRPAGEAAGRKQARVSPHHRLNLR